MNKGNERLMAILRALRGSPRWVLVLTTVGIIILLGVALFMLIPSRSTNNIEEINLSSTGLAFNVFLKLGFVVLIIIGIAIVVRQMQSKIRIEKTDHVQIIETVHLSPQRTIYLLSVEKEKILIGATDQNISTLLLVSSINSALDLETKDKNEDFSKFLAKAQGKKA